MPIDGSYNFQTYITSFFKDKKSLTTQIEKRGNSGFVDKSFEIMMTNVGWRDGLFWCAFYMKLVLMSMYSFDREFIKSNIGGGALNNLWQIYNLNELGDMTYQAVVRDPNAVPLPGDVFCLSEKGGDYGNGHTGMVIEVLDESTGLCKTLEGNTNLSGGRNGQGTGFLKRYLKIGQKTGGMVCKGWFRRVFSEQEMSSLYYDENFQSFVFLDNPVVPLTNGTEDNYFFAGGD